MIIFTLRTDKPEAEIGMFEDKKQLAYESWQAHQQLAETIHQKIESLLKSQQKSWHDIGGIVVFKGPGSFTGLRIGLSVANALAYSLSTNIVGSTDDNWLNDGIEDLLKKSNEKMVLPEYGAEVNITEQKK